MRKKSKIQQFIQAVQRAIFKIKIGKSAPYIQGLVLGVIDNDQSYYFYEEIDRVINDMRMQEINSRREKTSLIPDEKVLYCIYRIVNELQPRCVYMYGEDLSIYEYVIQSVDQKIVLKPYSQYLLDDDSERDKCLIFCNDGFCDEIITLFENIHVGAVVITHGLHWRKSGKMDWAELVQSPKISASLQTKEMGLAFTDLKLTKQNYYIKY